MSGKILVVDAVATNRILLKVKLSAANFDVHQATRGSAAVAMALQLRPDLIMLGATLSDIGLVELIDALRAHPELAIVPIVSLLPDDTSETRIAALRTGVDDIISQPIDERIMFARLRGLLRQHNLLQDMRLNAGPDGTTGLSETRSGLLRAGRITILGAPMSDATTLRTRLRSVCRHHITALQAGGPITSSPGAPTADVFVLLIPPGSGEAGLELMAELRASPNARHSRILCLLSEGSKALTASLLDLGASDVVIGSVALDELSLRLNRQIERKQTIDHLRTRLHDGLRAAMIDPLTGLYNRRFAMPLLRELAMGQDEKAQGFAVMVADLDHFKQINDRLGHAAGDRVLCHVADLLSNNLREGDLVARIGGEEFLIIMPGTDGAEARATADRLCRCIAEHGIALRSQGAVAHVTVSIGVAMGEGGASKADAAIYVEMLLEQADQALYRAKAKGRNNVTISACPAA